MVEPRDDGDDLAQGLGEVSHVGCDSCLTLRRAISTEKGEEVLVVGHSSDSNLGRRGERERESWSKNRESSKLPQTISATS